MSAYLMAKQQLDTQLNGKQVLLRWIYLWYIQVVASRCCIFELLSGEKPDGVGAEVGLSNSDIIELISISGGNSKTTVDASNFIGTDF